MVPWTFPALIERNRRAFSSATAVREFRQAEGWLDPGEQAATEAFVDLFRGSPLLDLGVGAGRTAPLLTTYSPDYVGVDYVEAMVCAARKRFSSLRFMHADVRDLSAFADATFGLVNMSNNMID